MELSNALKSLLATLSTQTSILSNSYGVMLASTLDGTPYGKIGAVDLAKSLNILQVNVLSNGADPNTVKEAGFFQANSWNSNAPTQNAGILIIPFFREGYCQTQFFVNRQPNPEEIYFRAGTSSSFTRWQKITLDVPSWYSSYANLAQLTSAVYKGQWYGDCTTAADTAAKTCTITGFLAVPTSVVTVHFASAINVAASTLNGTTATLNISGTGAKPIMYKGVPVQPGVVRAGNLVTMQYDGTNYNIIGIEGLEASAVPSNLYVDMGLPSGTLWATRNIDITQANGFAASEYQYECSFFSWGNTEGHNPTSASSFSPYDWGSANDGPYASTPGSKIMGQLSPSQDFARANCGAPWRLPTTADFAELFANIEYIDAQGSVIASSTTDKRTTMNGITGLRIRSTVNGNIIFFPCSGSGNGTSWDDRGAGGYYWSSSLLSAAHGRLLFFYSGGVNPQVSNYRFSGFAARPVQ